MGLQPYDAKSSVDSYRLLFLDIPYPILFLINFHPYIFPPIKTTDTSIPVAMETYVVVCFFYL